jgi:hypothetical protein
VAFADWSREEFEFFQRSATQDIFYQQDFTGLSNEDVGDAEALFERGWLDFNISEEERYEARLEFADLMGYPVDFRTGAPMDFDWDTFRELYDAAGG